MDICDRLAADETHYQPWERSSAYTGAPGDIDGSMHRVAYTYLAGEYPARTGLPMETAPIFASPDRDAALHAMGKGKPSRLLTLDVPADQILLQNYKMWSEWILFGWCLVHWPGTHDCPDVDCCQESWSDSFKTGEDTILQAVLNRIEPEWVVADESA